MKFRVLVDTDVLLDFLLGRQPFFPASAEFFLLVQAGEIEAFVTPVIFSNLFYILRKKLTGPDAVATLRKLRLLTRVLRADESVVDQALASSFTDFEDAIQYYSALVEDLDAIVTRNKQDFRPAKLPVVTAEECIALHRSKLQ